MSVFKLERKLEAARPLLLLAEQITNSIPKSAYVVYFRNYSQAGLAYKNISQLKELLLPHNEIEFKIINFEQQREAVYIKSHSFIVQNGCVMIAAKFESWQIKIEGKVINQAREGEGMVDLSIKSIKGYDEFFNFRKRYKTLENITKKLQFKIDHRIKFKNNKQSYQFDLQQKNQQHFYLSSLVFEHPVSVALQEITSLEDYVSADVLQEKQIDLGQISRQKAGLELKVKFSNIFQLLFVFDFVNNTNFANADFIAIRLLETSARASFTKIGTENNINLHDCLKVTPLINNIYYDYQWGYLNQNLQKIKAKDTIYQHLDKLTLSTTRYSSFTNQEIIDLKKSTTLIFNVEGQLIKVPMVFVLEGINCIFNENVTVKFLIESITTNKIADQDQKSDKRRVFEMSLEQVMNLSKINRVLTSRGESMFTLKIINEETSYFIPFERRKANKSQFKKEVKDLMTKQEVTFKHDKKYYCLTHGSNESDQLYLLQSTQIAPFYLIEMTSSSSLSYQLVIGKEIIFQGSLFKHRIMGILNENMVQILSSQQGNTKIALSLNFKQVQQVNQSAATLYQFRHRLQFAEIAESNDVAYDIEIQFQKSSKLSNLRTKISPQLRRQSGDEGFFMKQFCNNGKAMVKQQSLMFTLKIKKIFYNQELNYFDNEQLSSKVIGINPSFEVMKKGSPLNVESQSYNTYQIDLYDKNIQKRMIYYFQVYAMKNQFLDYKDSSYKIRMPKILWDMSNASRNAKGDQFELAVLLNRKRKNGGKAQFQNNYQQEIIIDHYNYKDGLTLTIDKHEIAYSKVIDSLKLRCDVSDQYISWSPLSDWYFAILNTDASNFYFLLQRKFDPYEQKNRSQSDRSRKTVSRELSARSDKHKIDPLAKTINNLDLFKLKKKKNELVAQGRQLTARYVKKQEKIIALTRRLQEIQAEMIKRSKYQETKKSEIKKITKQSIKMKEFYRSICECGQRNPKYKGYCENCLKKLRERYQAYSKEYKEKSYEYQSLMFDEFNKKQKIQRLKKKIHAISNQDIIVMDTDDADTTDYFSKGLEEKHYKQQVQNLKVQLFEMEEQRVSLVQNSNWQMKKMEQKITQQDGLIYKNSQDYNNLKNRQAELAKLIHKEDK